MTFFLYMILALISFFPIVIWAYSFAFMTDNPLNKKSFLFGILAWGLSVFPILYLDKMSSFFSELQIFNISVLMTQMSGFFSSFSFSFWLGFLLIFMMFFSFIFWWFIFKNSKKMLKMYTKNMVMFFMFLFFLAIFVFILNFLLTKFDFKMNNSMSFWQVILDSFSLMVFYYMIVAFLEETSKYFNFLQSSVFHITNVKSWVECAIFVALWFSFVENILYLYNYFLEYNLSYDLVKLYFFSSIFSVMVHILCSSLVAFYFSKAYLLYKEKNLNFPYLSIFFYWFSLSLFFHLFFDISLSLGFSMVLFLYFIWWYLYVSSIFYKE